MVISLNDKSRRVRHWYKAHVYRMYEFRILCEQEQATVDLQEKKRIREKAERPKKKAAQHAHYGIMSLKIPEEEVRSFGLAIIAEVKKKNSPKDIIQKLLKENGQK